MGGFEFGLELGLIQKIAGFSGLVYFGFESRKSRSESKISGRVRVGSTFDRSSPDTGLNFLAFRSFFPFGIVR